MEAISKALEAFANSLVVVPVWAWAAAAGGLGLLLLIAASCMGSTSYLRRIRRASKVVRHSSGAEALKGAERALPSDLSQALRISRMNGTVPSRLFDAVTDIVPSTRLRLYFVYAAIEAIVGIFLSYCAQQSSLPYALGTLGLTALFSVLILIAGAAVRGGQMRANRRLISGIERAWEETSRQTPLVREAGEKIETIPSDSVEEIAPSASFASAEEPLPKIKTISDTASFVPAQDEIVRKPDESEREAPFVPHGVSESQAKAEASLFRDLTQSRPTEDRTELTEDDFLHESADEAVEPILRDGSDETEEFAFEERSVEERIEEEIARKEPPATAARFPRAVARVEEEPEEEATDALSLDAACRRVDEIAKNGASPQERKALAEELGAMREKYREPEDRKRLREAVLKLLALNRKK